jgi:hypothetical protein
MDEEPTDAMQSQEFMELESNSDYSSANDEEVPEKSTEKADTTTNITYVPPMCYTPQVVEAINKARQRKIVPNDPVLLDDVPLGRIGLPPQQKGPKEKSKKQTKKSSQPKETSEAPETQTKTKKTKKDEQKENKSTTKPDSKKETVRRPAPTEKGWKLSRVIETNPEIYVYVHEDGRTYETKKAIEFKTSEPSKKIKTKSQNSDASSSEPTKKKGKKSETQTPQKAEEDSKEQQSDGKRKRARPDYYQEVKQSAKKRKEAAFRKTKVLSELDEDQVGALLRLAGAKTMEKKAAPMFDKAMTTLVEETAKHSVNAAKNGKSVSQREVQIAAIAQGIQE